MALVVSVSLTNFVERLEKQGIKVTDNKEVLRFIYTLIDEALAHREEKKC